MARYIDCYVLPVPRKNLAAYRRLARAWGRIMKDYGYLAYREFVSAGVTPMANMPSIERLVKPKKGELVIVSIVEFRSKAHRDRANARGWKDPRMLRLGKSKPLFDMKRMHVGELETLVEG